MTDDLDLGPIKRRAEKHWVPGAQRDVAALIAEVERLRGGQEAARRPVHPGIGRPWPLIETAKVRLARPGEDCRHCDARPAAVIVEDGVLADEEHAICAPCLLDALLAYPEHGEAGGMEMCRQCLDEGRDPSIPPTPSRTSGGA